MGDRIMSFDWNMLEDAWVRAATDALVGLATAHPDERIYAGAFWMLYGDYSSIQVPAFGANAESAAEGQRWAPPDWAWSMGNDAHEHVRTLSDPLQDLEIDEGAFEALWAEHIAMLGRVCRRVTSAMRAGDHAGAFTSAFFVGILDQSQDEALAYLKQSADEATLEAAGVLEVF